MFSSIVIGYLISRVTKTKLIIDYRDPWTTHNHKFCKIFGKKIGRLFEKSAVKYASAIVFSTKKMKTEFEKCLGKYTNSICRVINSGYQISGVIQPLSLGNHKINMIYAGNLYGERRMKLLAKTLYELKKEKIISKTDFCFHHFGEFNDQDIGLINKYGLQEIVERHPPVNYDMMIRYLKGADILYLPSGSDVSYAIPFKLYDYLSVRRPIFAIAPENSAVADMLREIDCGRLSIINREESITENLRAMLLETKEYSYSGAEKYTWKNSAKKYFKVIKEVC
jgi:glycosyltransferase involved in cell wall biosynthesis